MGLDRSSAPHHPLPMLRQYRIVYAVGRLEFTWIRSGESSARVTELAKRALQDAHNGQAVLVTVERLEVQNG